MYLLDTNIWLERLLGQTQSADDAYQYVAAERDNVGIISFDTHFDQTDRGRQTAAQVLATLRRP